MTAAMPAEVLGLTLAASGNAIDLTAVGAYSGTSVLSIAGNVIQSAGAEGIDINAGATGTLGVTILGNSWIAANAHVGNAVDITRTAGTLNLNISANANIKSTGTAVLINGGAAASTNIIGFANNSVDTLTLGAGVVMSNVTFDSNLALGGIQQVDGDILTIGIDGNGVGGTGMSLTAVQGSLFFDDLDVYGGTSGLVVNGAGGSGMTLAVTPPTSGGTSEIKGINGSAVDVTSAAVDLRLSELVSTTLSTGVSLNTVSGQFTAPAGSTITKLNGAGALVSIDNSAAGTTALTAIFAGTITNGGASSGRPILVNNADTGSTVTFSGAVTGTAGPGQGVSLTNNTGATITFQRRDDA